ncbi:uncharacterized protein VNE69_05124 [Vairimorpha necatrix]|uniref:Uncharacterized protein n=1 Tax=Vairimorpha necatrix TaxID=6039 RepID=A0AAX4JCB9_9MICR
MAFLYKGSIIEFKDDLEYDYVNINGKRVDNTHYYIPLEYKEIKTWDNYTKFVPSEDNLLFIDYIKKVKCDDQIGILKYREFEGPFYKEEIVLQETCKLEYPFLFSQYSDGVSVYLKLTNVKIEYNLTSDGFLRKYEDNLYKLTDSTTFLIDGENGRIHFSYTTKSTCKYKFNITQSQVIIFPDLLIDKYMTLEDKKKNEVVEMYNEMINSKELILYRTSEKGLESKYQEKSAYKIHDTIIYNIKNKKQKVDLEKIDLKEDRHLLRENDTETCKNISEKIELGEDLQLVRENDTVTYKNMKLLINFLDLPKN